jgi:hypothetical protein
MKKLFVLLFVMLFAILSYSQEIPSAPSSLSVQIVSVKQPKLKLIGFVASELVMYGGITLDLEMTRRGVGTCALEGNPMFALPPYDKYGNGYNFNTKKAWAVNLATSVPITIVHGIVYKKTNDKIANWFMNALVAGRGVSNLQAGIKWYNLCH